MTDIKTRFSELIALTQLYLLREHPPHHPFSIDPKNFQYFKPLIKKNIPKSAQTPPSYIPPQPPPKPAPKVELKPPSAPKVEFTLSPQPKAEPAAPPPPPSKPVEIKQTPSFFTLEPFAATATPDLEDSKQTFKRLFPQHPVLDQIPSDQIAKSLKNVWNVEMEVHPVLLLSFNDQEKHLAFLKNMAQAITLHLGPARVLSGPALEQEKKWEHVLNSPNLRLIIASDYGLYLLPSLMKFYKENSRTAKHFIHQTPLLLLSDLSLYLKEPQLKPLLWRAICAEFESSRKI